MFTLPQKTQKWVNTLITACEFHYPCSNNHICYLIFMAWFYEQLTDPYFNWGLIIYTGNISFSLEWLHAGEWLSLLLDKKRNIFELLGTIEIFYKLHLQSYLLFTYFLTVKTFLWTKISYHKKKRKRKKENYHVRFFVDKGSVFLPYFICATLDIFQDHMPRICHYSLFPDLAGTTRGIRIGTPYWFVCFVVSSQLLSLV